MLQGWKGIYTFIYLLSLWNQLLVKVWSGILMEVVGQEMGRNLWDLCLGLLERPNHSTSITLALFGVTPGEFPGLFLSFEVFFFSGPGPVVWAHSCLCTNNGRNGQHFLKCDYSWFVQDVGVWSRAVPSLCACSTQGTVPLIPWARTVESPINKQQNGIHGMNYGAREVWGSLLLLQGGFLKQGQVPKSEGWEILPPHWDLA